MILIIMDHEKNIEKEYVCHSLHQKESEIIIKQWNDNEEEIKIKIPINKNDNLEWIPERLLVWRSE